MPTSLIFRASLAFFAVAAHAASPQFFIQLSDPQMGMFAKDANTEQDEANLRFAVDNINRLHPAFVVITGDLVNKVGDVDQIRKFRAILSRVDPGIPVYNVAGNHDVGNVPTPDQLRQYRQSIAKDYYSFDAGSIRGLVLNSSLIGSPNSAQTESQAQESWLRKELERAKGDRVAHLIVFQHIPYFLESASESDQYFNIPTPIRARYLQWFHDAGIRNVFAGHYHRNAFGRDGELEMVTTGPVGMPLGKDQSGMRVVRIAEGTIESRYYELGSLPNRIDANKPLPERVIQ